jgi:UDP-N-acetylmuramoylalanine--D-glutamate ligase
VRVADTRAAPPYLAELNRRAASADSCIEFRAGEFAPELLAGVDLLVLSPGLPGNLPVVAEARRLGLAVVGEIELFAWGLGPSRDTGEPAAGDSDHRHQRQDHHHGPDRPSPVGATGKRVGVAGNISPAALTALMDAGDAQALPQIWVLELSSFQLETTRTLFPAAATVLNISDDHLDRYAGTR